MPPPPKPMLQHQQQVLSLARQRPERFVYSFLRLAAGPVAPSGEKYDMNTRSSPAAPSEFEYMVPSGEVFIFSRVNLIVTATDITPDGFGDINGGLSYGSSLQVIGLDGSILKDFSDGIRIQTNDDFYALAGVDAPIKTLPVNDTIPIRFSIFKAGFAMELQGGEKIRWTNRDDLRSLIKFRAMVQGALVD